MKPRRSCCRAGTGFPVVLIALVFAGMTGHVGLRGESTEITLWPDGAPDARGTEEADRPSITVYGPPEDRSTGAAIVVCPGGGYGHLAMGHEGKDVADWLNSFGVTACVLRYRIAPRYHYPAPLDDARRAIRLVRHRSQDLGLDPGRIGILGFSAGGHLASSVGTHFDDGESEAADPVDRSSCRPDFMVLVYPVISFTSEFAHRGSRSNFLGASKDPELAEKFSNEKQVTARTPPTFLVHTWEDRAVPAENSIHFYLAMRRADVPGELHLFEQGRHGLGLAPGALALSAWPRLCQSWLHHRGILGEAH